MKKTLLATILVGVTLAATPTFRYRFEHADDFFFPAGRYSVYRQLQLIRSHSRVCDCGFDRHVDPSLSNILVAHKVIHLSGDDINMTVRGPLNTTNFPDVSLTGTWQITGGTRGLQRCQWPRSLAILERARSPTRIGERSSSRAVRMTIEIQLMTEIGPRQESTSILPRLHRVKGNVEENRGWEDRTVFERRCSLQPVDLRAHVSHLRHSALRRAR